MHTYIHNNEGFEPECRKDENDVFQKSWKKKRDDVSSEWKKDRSGKKFKHLGYDLRENNKKSDKIERVKRKANGCLEKICSIGERKFKDDWGK